MRSLKPDAEPTRDDDLSDWRTFCLAYYESIVHAFRFLRASEDEADELAHTFVVKVEGGRFLDAFRQFRGREAAGGRRARFRSYLYQSLQNHARDAHRRRSTRSKERALEPDEAAAIAAEPERRLDPDALYALDILHQTLQAFRTHCERTGKPHIWAVFEETFLADEFRGRRRKNRAELLEMLGRDEPQALDNALTTAKRAFRRFAYEVIPCWPGEDADPSARFADWMETLRDSNASQFDLLHLAYRVSPHLDHSSHGDSASLVVPDNTEESSGYGPPDPVSDDELSVLVSLWLEKPLNRWLDVSEWTRFLPRLDRSPPRPGAPGSPGGRRRPPCLLTFLDPTPAEADALRDVDMLDRLARLKSLAKQLHLRTDHAVPKVFSELIYTAVATRALVRYATPLHSIGPASLERNLGWFLGRPWLDDRLRPLLEAGLVALEAARLPSPDPAIEADE